MYRPFREDRKRRFSEMEPVYCGPEEFMEAGVRGFLVTTQADKEEFAIDDAIDLLRQASVMIYGGIKPRLKKGKPEKGYVKIDFMDPGDVQILPVPEGEVESESEEEEKKEGGDKDKVEKEKAEEGKDGDAKEDAEAKEESKEAGDDTKKENEDKEEEDKEKTEQMESEQKDAEEGKEEETEKVEKEKHGSSKKHKKKKAKKEDEKPSTYMRCMHKFKAFRTEIRNMLFVKSNVPDPLELASAAMQLVLQRRKVAGEAMVQLLPVYGVCNYDLMQLEIMTQRVLRPLMDETLPPKSFNVMIFDKISEPGTDLLAETVRNAIWCLNPASFMSSPLTEPDVVIRVELIGSKLVLCAMTNFMMYRQYCPTLLVSMGPGCPEDDDLTDMNEEMRTEYEQEQERIKQRKQAAEERKQREEEERQKLAAERRARDEERRKHKQEEKERKAEERKIREEESRKRKEEKKKAEEEKKKQEEEEERKLLGEDEDEGGEGKVEEKSVAEGGEDGNSQEEPDQSLNESTASADAEMASDDEEKPKRRGRRAGRGKAKGKARK